MAVALATVDQVRARPDDEHVAPAQPQEPPAAPAETRPATPPAEWDSQITALTSRLTAVDARLTEFTDRLGATRDRVEAAQAGVDAVEVSEAGTAGRVAVAEGRLDSTDTAVRGAHQQIASITDRLGAVGTRLDSLDNHIAALQHHGADHDRSLADLKRTIAAEVERHTTDALVDSRHSLQLAVNSIAQLALAMAESSRDITQDVSAESATVLLDSFRVDLDVILAQLGFVPVGTTVGATFDPHRHRALKRVPTSDPAQDKAITRVIRDGYVSAATGRILLFADVEVSRYRA